MAHPENLLFRSHIEIVRLMQVLAQERCRITAEIMNGHPFASHMVSFDPASGHFAISYSPHKTINAMLLSSPAVEFTATDQQGLNFTFTATSPEETQIGGEPAIQFSMPKSLLIHNRREHPRIPVPTDLSLRCIADEGGFIPFESHITDVSHDGMGCLIYDTDINLEDGAMLHGCRIIVPGGDAVVADMELRHVASVQLPDGTLAHRAGFRFVQKPNEIARLIGLFIQDLDKLPKTP
ncbi:MAG: flagellar brake protein [Nitrosomonadales bacterium]|nr:flagellar brake protein [Nitrosomonadales bacterium]